MMKFFARGSFLGAATALLVIAAGCGRDGREAGEVSGKVTVKGQPLPDVGVNFEPVVGGAGRGSTGRTDSTGAYTLRFIDNNQSGALVGKHQVSFTDLQNIGGQDEPDGGPAMPKRKSRLPAKAMSQPLEYEVKPGPNQADFDLN